MADQEGIDGGGHLNANESRAAFCGLKIEI